MKPKTLARVLAALCVAAAGLLYASPYIALHQIGKAVERRDAQALPDIFVRDVELDIKYLMGRNFHRGQDQDLGPAESVGI